MKNTKIVSVLVLILLLNAGCLKQTEIPVETETGSVNPPDEIVEETGALINEDKDFRLELEKHQAEIQANHPEKVKIFLTLLNDKGRFGKEVGCGGSVVGVLRSVDNDKIPVVAALEELFSIKDDLNLIKDEDFKDLYEEISGKELGIGTPPPGSENTDFLYNMLGISDLKLSSVLIEDGVANIKILGPYAMRGHCDGHAFREQIKQTVLQFSFIKEANICIDNRPIEEFGNLSGKPIIENYCEN